MVLNELKALLEKEEFDCTLIPSTMQVPFDRLLVHLGLDAKERERLLEIMASQQPVSPEFVLPQSTPLPYRLQFRIQLPFKVQDMALSQVSSLLLFLNQFIDLPGFELNELEGEVLYRYVWIIHPTAIDATLLMSILGSMMLNLGLFTDTIETLANGKMSFNELLAQVIKIAENSPSSLKLKKSLD